MSIPKEINKVEFTASGRDPIKMKTRECFQKTKPYVGFELKGFANISYLLAVEQAFGLAQNYLAY